MPPLAPFPPPDDQLECQTADATSITTNSSGNTADVAVQEGRQLRQGALSVAFCALDCACKLADHPSGGDQPHIGAALGQAAPEGLRQLDTAQLELLEVRQCSQLVGSSCIQAQVVVPAEVECVQLSRALQGGGQALQGWVRAVGICAQVEVGQACGGEGGSRIGDL